MHQRGERMLSKLEQINNLVIANGWLLQSHMSQLKVFHFVHKERSGIPGMSLTPEQDEAEGVIINQSERAD